MDRNDPTWLVLVLAVALAITYMASTHYFCAGNLVAPQDDAYIYFQYARQIARGQPWRYHDGAARSTGATGFLYPFLLAPVFFLADDTTMIVMVAFVIGLASLIATAILIHHIVRRTHPAGWGVIASLIFLLNGHVLWTFFSGLEAGLFTLVCVGVTYLTLQALDFDNFPTGAALLAALLVWIRPEGAILAIAWAAATAWKLRARGRSRASSLAPFLACLSIPLYLLANYLVAGRFVGNTGVKPLLSYGLAPQWIRPLSAIYGKIVQLFLGLRFEFVVLPFLGILALWEIASGWDDDTGNDLLAGWWLLGMGLIGYASFQGGSTDLTFRYVVPYYPPFILLVAQGLARLARASRTASAKVLTTCVLGYGAAGTIVMAAFFGTCCKATYGLHGAAARWLRGQVRKGAIVATGDVGVLGFESGHPIFDIVGLTTNAMTWNSQLGDGALYEAVAHVPAEKRPTHLCFYPRRFTALAEILRGSHRASFSVREIFYRGTRFDIHEVAPDAFRPAAYLPRPGLTQVDALDIACLADEKRHGYEIITEPGFRPATLLKKLSDTGGGPRWADGGRLALGERLRVRGCARGKPLHVVLLTTSISRLDLVVKVDGKIVGAWRAGPPPVRGESWVEHKFVVDGRHIKESEIDLALEPPDMTTYVYYQSFGYRFMHPR